MIFDKELIPSNLEEYNKLYKYSVENPEQFWSDVAESFIWKKKWSKVLEYEFSKPKFEWFVDGKLNITENCLDRHVENTPEKTAIIFEPNNPSDETLHISYKELHSKVCSFANVLKKNNVKKGDRVCIYLPMVPELAIAVLACARIGAIHSVVFAGFSSTALAARINDASCKMVLTSDGSYRGNKTIDLKSIVNEALNDCDCVESVIVLNRINNGITLNKNEKWWHDELSKVNDDCPAEIMDSEDSLFILYTSGSTGKPKGMVHTTGGYMVGTTYTFQNVFQINEQDVYWCTADIGWITGHSYIIYGPLCSGATTVMFEGVPSYPDFGRFWEVVAKLKVTHFYTAPTAIRALEKHPLDFVKKHNLSSLKVLGSVGEPINEEAWHWYNDNIGQMTCPIVDTWWQTETGGIMISPLAGITPLRPTFATQPLPGVQPVLMDENGQEVYNPNGPCEGRLAIKKPWPSIARTIYGDHKRYKETYFSAFPGYYFTGDGAYRDAMGNYRITGRVDDVVIVSGHNLGTAPIENIINEHQAIVECAIVGYPHDIKGNALYAYVTKYNDAEDNEELLRVQINQLISSTIGPIAKLDKIQFVSGLPKTRSGKIMRRILRKIASDDASNLGDISTLLNPEVVEEIKTGALI